MVYLWIHWLIFQSYWSKLINWRMLSIWFKLINFQGVTLQSKRCAMCRREIPQDYLFNPELLDQVTRSIQYIINPEYLVYIQPGVFSIYSTRNIQYIFNPEYPVYIQLSVPSTYWTRTGEYILTRSWIVPPPTPWHYCPKFPPPEGNVCFPFFITN